MPPVRKPKPAERESAPKPERASEPTILVAATSFACTLDGENISVRADKTRVASDHPLALAYPDYFKPASEGSRSFGIEDASASPGAKRNR